MNHISTDIYKNNLDHLLIAIYLMITLLLNIHRYFSFLRVQSYIIYPKKHKGLKENHNFLCV